MAPLDRFTYTPVPSETYVTFHNHDWRKDYYILSQRDVVVGKHPLYEFNAPESPSTSASSSQPSSFQALVDMFTENLCLCPHQQQRLRPQRNANGARALTVHNASVAAFSPLQKNIVYPVARYKDRLDNEELVQQRRKSLRRYSSFVPVVVE
jgi:hypothetical protein